jgi:hypothetical protein
MEQDFLQRYEEELNQRIQAILNNPSPSIEDLWFLPEDEFFNWRRKYDYLKLIDSFNKHKPNFLKWKAQYKLTDEEIMSYRLSSFFGHKGLKKEKVLYLIEQTFDDIKRNIVAHTDLSKKTPLPLEKGEAYELKKRFLSYADWCNLKR